MTTKRLSKRPLRFLTRSKLGHPIERLKASIRRPDSRSFKTESTSRKAHAVQAFSKLDKPFQDNYISGVGKVIAGKSSGTVAGVPFGGFDELVKCFSKSYVEDGALRLMGDVFTLLMGNPTWEKLDKLLRHRPVYAPGQHDDQEQADGRAGREGVHRGNP